MALFGIFGRKNPLEALSIDELKERELKLKIKSDRLTEEIAEIEKEINFLFQKSKEAKSRMEEISIANRIKSLAQKKEMKAKAHAELERELRAVSNLLIIKEHEADLKEMGKWEALQKIPPEKLEDYLIKEKLAHEDREARRKMVIEMTSSMIKAAEEEYEEGLGDILTLMREVKEGKLEPEKATKEITEKEKE